MVEAIIFITAYILGSIPSALIIGKVGYGIDVREHGSGNLGGTNAFRVLGKKAGLSVTIADILKGTLAASLPVIFGLEHIHPLLVGFAAILGHTYPIFAKFKGGKAVATSGGVVLFYAPFLFISLLVVFFLILYITKYVSLSSMLIGIYALIYSIITQDLALILTTSLMTAFIFYRHRTNVKRILNKTEPKIKWM